MILWNPRLPIYIAEQRIRFKTTAALGIGTVGDDEEVAHPVTVARCADS
jgi:hypothetical protein